MSVEYREQIIAARLEQARYCGLIDLAGLNLATLPPALTSVSQITTLILDDNQLTEIPPDSLTQLPQLHFLSLRNNKLSTTPFELFHRQNLLLTTAHYHRIRESLNLYLRSQDPSLEKQANEGFFAVYHKLKPRFDALRALLNKQQKDDPHYEDFFSYGIDLSGNPLTDIDPAALMLRKGAIRHYQQLFNFYSDRLV